MENVFVKFTSENEVLGKAGELEKFEGSMKIWAKLSRWGKVDWVPGSSYYTNMKLTNEDFDIKK